MCSSVDLRFDSAAQIDAALVELVRHCHMVKELGRYVARLKLLEAKVIS